MWPLLNIDDLVGASFLPTDGRFPPILCAITGQGRTHAWRKAYRGRSGDVVRYQGWPRYCGEHYPGKIICEKVVNCGGQWAGRSGPWPVSVPLQPVKHQYVITEKVAGLAADAATIRDPDRRTYFKEEVGGLVFGGYEPDPIAWTQGDVPDNFEFQLFEDDWDHFEQHMTEALVRVPALENTGIKKMIHGPESFTPMAFHSVLHRNSKFMWAPVAWHCLAAVLAGYWRTGWRDEAPMDLWVVDIRRFRPA
jgi:4-methylaminobutanoate oxidase (formaldehyde-forming)